MFRFLFPRHPPTGNGEHFPEASIHCTNPVRDSPRPLEPYGAWSTITGPGHPESRGQDRPLYPLYYILQRAGPQDLCPQRPWALLSSIPVKLSWLEGACPAAPTQEGEELVPRQMHLPVVGTCVRLDNLGVQGSV